MTKRPVRAAVIGVGYLGRFHAAKYAADPGCELIAVADPDPGARARVAGEHGVEAVADFRALLSRVDAVSIAVPTPMHFEVARTCLEHGVHVLLEKPIAVTVAQADALVALARSRALCLQVGHLERFNPALRALAERTRTPRFFESYRVAPFRERGIDVDVVLDLMIHDIDLVQHLCGSPLREVFAIGAAVFSDKPDMVNARLHFESGCVANLTASRTSTKMERKIRSFERDCYVSADLLERRLKVCRKALGDAGHAEPRLDVERLEFEEHDPLRLEIQAFVASVATGAPVAVPGEDGRAALATAVRIGELVAAAP